MLRMGGLEGYATRIASKNVRRLIEPTYVGVIDIEEEAKNGKVIETRLLPTPG